jgi:XTP/dITP diphosphohydrolase
MGFDRCCPIMKLHLASGNAHKASELQALAERDRLGVEIISACSVGGMPAVKEDADTFVGNARKKARALRSRLPAGAWVLADDSGLGVDALAGAPGVESAYFAGPEGDPAANLAKLVGLMCEVPDPGRRAHFECVLLIAGPQGAEHIFQGRCEGRLLSAPCGSVGFGYDPLFEPEGFTGSFAELGDAVKNCISHRARAWARLAEWIREMP